MRIVDRKTFLAMPIGTVYQKYQPCCFDALMIKGETCASNDWFEQEIGGNIVGTNNSEEFFTACEAMQRGETRAIDFDIQGRDGLFDNEQLFAVWDRDDVTNLIARLTLALEGAE